jgi:hypothetical protein
MIFQAHSPQDMLSHPYASTKMSHPTSASQLKIVSFNIWDLPYWFVKNRRQRILQIAAYLQKLDAEIICLQESFDVHHRRLLYEHLGCERYYASGGFAATRQVPLAVFDTTGGLVIFSKFPIIQHKFMPFHHFTPSLVERIGRKGVLEATIETPYGVMQVFNIHLHMGINFFARRARIKQLKIPPGIFLPAVLLSALTWSGGYVTAGKLLGHEYATVVQKLGIGKAVLACLVFICLIGFLGPHVYHWIKKRRIPPSGWSYAQDNGGNDQE